MKSFKKFLERLKPHIPESEWEAFVKGVTQPLDRSIRVSNIKYQISNNGWTLTNVKGISEAFLIDREDRSQPLGKTLSHFNGDFYVQTLSSMLPVLALDPQPEEKILDVCAAPGSKSTFLSEKMGNTGVLICNEMSASRIKKLVANLNRTKCLNTAVTQIDGQKLDLWYSQEFQKILLDAPCTSEGHGRKDASFFEKTWKEKAIAQAAKLQRKLIEQAFLVLKEGGEMVYSTCTMAGEENELVVQWLVDNYGDYLQIIPHGLPKAIPFRAGLKFWGEQEIYPEISKHSARIWPHIESKTFSSEAFYLCKIRKTQGLSRPNPPRKGELETDFKIIKKNERAEIITRLHKTWGLDKALLKDLVLIQKNEILFMATKDTVNFASKNKVQRLGFKVMDEYGFLSSEFAIAFGEHMNNNIVQLNEDQMPRWMRGEDLPLEGLTSPQEDRGALNPEVLIKYKAYTLGTGKWMEKEGRLKNRLDRNLLWR
ncbi:MAG TPA: NOL1/NOP2/sun family putative RNA methylase [Candidatus Gracilibacteria bacterium]